MTKRYFLILFLFFLLSNGCSNSPLSNSPEKRKFHIKHLAKNSISNVLDIQAYQLRQLLMELMIKLYKRNPKQLNRSPFNSIEKNVTRVFGQQHDWAFKQLNYKQSIDALQMTFDESYQGDRVFPFIVGLSSMLIKAYGNKTDFYILDKVDAQKLYDSARNIEIAVWKLTHAKDKSGELLLYSNSLPHETTYLSYERLFGKLISIQDTSAIIIENKSKRIIRKVLKNIAVTVAFIPI